MSQENIIEKSIEEAIEEVIEVDIIEMIELNIDKGVIIEKREMLKK